MTWEEAEKIIKSNDINSSNLELFMKNNIILKIKNYSTEHIILLKKIYDYSLESINANKKDPNVSYSKMEYLDIKINIDDNIKNICWQDLLRDDFIVEVKPFVFSLRPLGVFFIEKLLQTI